MSTQNKEINHDFNIGDVVYILNEHTIIRSIIIGINCNTINSKESNPLNIIDKTTICYKVKALLKYKDKESNIVFEASSYPYDIYDYHSSKVYTNVDDLLSDLRNSIEKSS